MSRYTRLILIVIAIAVLAVIVGKLAYGGGASSSAATRMRRPAVVAAMLALAACGSEELVVIDGSSPEAFERTTAEARRQLPDAQRLKFDEALRAVGGRRHAERDPAALARVTFGGMTAAEVVADQQGRGQ